MGRQRTDEASRPAPRARARTARRANARERKKGACHAGKTTSRTEPLGDVEPAHDARDLPPRVRALRRLGGRLLSVAFRRRGRLLHGEGRELARQRLPLPAAHRRCDGKTTRWKRYSFLAAKIFQGAKLRLFFRLTRHTILLEGIVLAPSQLLSSIRIVFFFALSSCTLPRFVQLRRFAASLSTKKKPRRSRLPVRDVV